MEITRLNERFPNVFALGDAGSASNAKTAAALLARNPQRARVDGQAAHDWGLR